MEEDTIIETYELQSKVESSPFGNQVDTKEDICNFEITTEQEAITWTHVSSSISHKRSQSVYIQFRDLHFLRGDRVVLDNVAGEIKASKLTGIIGPSGTGKTTLLKVLSRQLPIQKGEILVNRVEISEFEQDMRRCFGFVPQEDILHPLMTTEELIEMSARLRLDRSVPQSVIKERVSQVIQMMGIEKIKDKVVGSIEHSFISGGQRKRVSIAMELVANPAVLLLDEPTSGLDSYIAKQLIAILKSLTDLGITVLTVLHQPNFQIFLALDDIIVMGKTAQICYNGPAKEALDYFDSMGFPLPPHTNPTDFFIDVASGAVRSKKGVNVRMLRKQATARLLRSSSFYNDNNPKKDRPHFERQNTEYLKVALPQHTGEMSESVEAHDIEIPQIGGMFRQFLTFLQFGFVSNISRAYKRMIAVSLVLLLVGMAFGGVFYQNDNSITVITIHTLATLGYSMVMVQYGISVHTVERDYFHRLCFNDVWKISYLAAMNITQALPVLIWPLLWLCGYFPLVGFHGFGTYYYVHLFLCICHIFIGVILSTFMRENARIAGICVCLLFTIVSGATPKLAELEASTLGRIVSTMSLYRHAQELLFCEEYSSFDFFWKAVVDDFNVGFTPNNFVLNISGLFFWWILLELISLTFLILSYNFTYILKWDAFKKKVFKKKQM